MKNKVAKRMLSILLAGALLVSGLVGCGSTTPSENTDSTDSSANGSSTENPSTPDSNQEKKTIMWLSNLSSGLAYECGLNFAEAICEELGYNFKVVYGDAFNDPAGNLAAVKNGMTDDVVAIISSQDGGLVNIMEEYPDLYVCGFNTDMRSVFSPDGPSAACLENENFLGTIVDGHADGALTGKEQAQAVIEQGYKKVSVLVFPAYAYPNLTAAEVSFRSEIEAYNSTASAGDKIEIIGDTKVLEFAPLEDSYFLDAAYQDLDAIVAFCAGIMFVYPSMKTALTQEPAVLTLN